MPGTRSCFVQSTQVKEHLRLRWWLSTRPPRPQADPQGSNASPSCSIQRDALDSPPSLLRTDCLPGLECEWCVPHGSKFVTFWIVPEPPTTFFYFFFPFSIFPFRLRCCKVGFWCLRESSVVLWRGTCATGLAGFQMDHTE